MNDSGPRHVKPATYSVDFGSFFSFRSMELIGRGEVEIHPTEPILELRGKTNAVFPRQTQRVFTSSEIKNLRGGARSIEFDAGDTPDPRRRRTLRFTCDSAEDAAAIRNALPGDTDHAFKELSRFHDSLDSLPQAASPWHSVTSMLIALNVLAFVVMGFMGAGWVETASMRPYIEFAANNGAATTQGEWWRLVTAMFVHYGLIHLAFNMWALLDAGRVVERLLGRLPFALAYLSSGLLSGFSSLLWHQDRTWSAGASGAVFGVYGMLLGFMLKEKASTPSVVLRPVLRSVLFFAGYNLLYGLIQPRIDNAAHIGGFVSGFGLGCILALPPNPKIRALRQKGRMLIALGATTALCAAGVALAPRYDYLFRERLALERAYGPTLHATEVAIRRQQAVLFGKIRKGGNTTELADWIEQSALPFYRSSAEKLAALQLTPGYRTDEERNAMLYVAHSKVANYERLVSDIRLMDPTALIRFDAAENAVSKSALEKLSPKGR